MRERRASIASRAMNYLPDRLALALGRRLPRLAVWLASALLWAAFAAAVLAWLRPGWLPEHFPADITLIPIFVALTVLSMIRQAAVRRRRKLLQIGSLPSRVSNPDLQRWPSAKPRPRLAWTLCGIVAIGMLAWTWFRIEAEERTIARKCEAYAQSIGAPPDHVVSCPYR